MSRENSFRIGLVACAALLAVHALALGYVSDDAFISFRYARNLLDGHGLVYNPGERVEGYTNFLWTVLLAGADFLLPGRHLPEIAKVLGLLFGAGTVLLTGLLGREVAGRESSGREVSGSEVPGRAISGREAAAREVPVRASPWLLLAPALVAADTSFAVWTTGGLESPLFSFLVVAAALAWLRWTKGLARPHVAPLLLGLATLARPEGALLFSVMAAAEILRGRGGLRALARWSWPFAAVVLPWFLWRWSYYGWPLPNTFYAKVGGGAEAWKRGLEYLGRFAGSHAWFLLPAPLALLLRPQLRAWSATLFALVAAYAGFIVAVGGDGLFQYRFCAHVAPLFYVLAQEGLFDLLGRAPRWTGASVAVLSVALTAQTSVRTLWLPASVRWTEPKSEVSFPDGGHGYRFFDAYFVERQRRAAEWLEKNAPQGATIASTPAGAIAYYTSHPVIDMLGLADEHIAHREVEGMGRGRPGHEKGYGAYVLSRKPEFILLGNVAVLARPLTEEEMPGKLVRRSEEEIWADPSFHRDYELVNVRLADSGPFQWFSYFRRTTSR